MKRPLLLLFSLLLVVILLVACEDESTVCEDSPAPNPHPSGLLYVPNQADRTIYIYDSETLIRVDSFDTPVIEPHFIKFSHDLAYYYIVGRQVGGQVAKYTAANDSLISVVTVPGAVFPTSCDISLNNDTLYLTDFTNAAGHTHRFDVSGQNLTWMDSILQAGHQTHDISISSDGKYLVSAGFNSDDITIVNTQTGDLVPLTLDSAKQQFNPASGVYGPYGVLIDLNSSMAIVSCSKGVDQLRLFDLKNLTLIDSILIPVSNILNPNRNGPTYMTILPDNNTLFLTNYSEAHIHKSALGINQDENDNTASVIRLSTREIIKSIHFSTIKPFGITSSPDGSRVYVTCTNTRPAPGTVYIIDGNSLSVLDSLTVGSEPFGIAWRPPKS